MKNVETRETMEPEVSALICWYYQCKEYTLVRISIITHLDIEVVKTALRRNCQEFKIRERQEKLNKAYADNMHRALGVHKNQHVRCHA